MILRASLTVLCLLSPVLAWPQQANVNLDFNPQKNTGLYYRFLPNLLRKD